MRQRGSPLRAQLVTMIIASAGVLLLAGSASASEQRTEIVATADIRVVLTYVDGRDEHGLRDVTDVWIAITRHGVLTVEERLDGPPPNGTVWPAGVGGSVQSVQILNIDLDAEDEVVFGFFTGGANCCSATFIYRWDDEVGRYVRLRRDWGWGYRLRDLDGDGIAEFESSDWRFKYVFTSGAQSRAPLQIFRYRGAFRDVTRQYPALARRHGRAFWSEFQKARRSNEDVRGILAAYLADRHLAREGAAGWQAILKAYRRGDLDQPPWDIGAPPYGARYIKKLCGFLKQTGYMERSQPCPNTRR